jgi:hypothetical protein
LTRPCAVAAPRIKSVHGAVPSPHPMSLRLRAGQYLVTAESEDASRKRLELVQPPKRSGESNGPSPLSHRTRHRVCNRRRPVGRAPSPEPDDQPGSRNSIMILIDRRRRSRVPTLTTRCQATTPPGFCPRRAYTSQPRRVDSTREGGLHCLLSGACSRSGG